MRVRWARRSSGDLEQIGDYIARDSPLAAQTVVLRILDQTDMLATHPHLGRVGRIDGTRELIVADTPYIAVYRVTGEEVEILAVFHGARRWPDDISDTRRQVL